METVLESRSINVLVLSAGLHANITSQHSLLDDLPPDLIEAVSNFCRERQGARMPISRSGLLTQELMDKHRLWLADLDVAKATGG